jgi:hypothetical protein
LQQCDVEGMLSHELVLAVPAVPAAKVLSPPEVGVGVGVGVAVGRAAPTHE